MLTLSLTAAVAFTQENPADAVRKLERAWLDACEQHDARRERYTDTYVKRNGRWQVVASHLSNIK
ncbi:MAG: hypothetical protein ACT4OT_01845 [Acidobacteriota bacterium]